MKYNHYSEITIAKTFFYKVRARKVKKIRIIKVYINIIYLFFEV